MPSPTDGRHSQVIVSELSCGDRQNSTRHFPALGMLLEDMRVRNFSSHTQSTYVLQVSLFARYFRKPPDQLGPEEIRSYQVYLTDERKLAPGSILIAVAALRFLYKVTLRKDWRVEDIIPAPKKPQKLP